jgi:penicillin-binding protein 1C
VIALDPDIPAELQRIFFISQPRAGRLQWVLNDHAIMEGGKDYPWAPQAGSYTMSLVDAKGRIIDTVQFEVGVLEGLKR